MTRNEVENARSALSQELQEATGRILGSQHAQQSDNRQVAFFSRLLGLRAVELKALLLSHGIEPIETKHALAEIAATELREGDLEDFVAARKRPRRDAEQPAAPGKQRTLDALFAQKN